MVYVMQRYYRLILNFDFIFFFIHWFNFEYIIDKQLHYFLNFFFSSRRRHTRCQSVTGVQTCALPIFVHPRLARPPAEREGYDRAAFARSEEHTSELQSLTDISYAVFCLKKKK